MPTTHVIDGKTCTLETEKWSRSGRTCRVLDEHGKPTGQKAYVARVGEENVLVGKDYKPYHWDDTAKELLYAGSGLAFASDGQVANDKDGAKTDIEKTKFFVEKWDGAKWVTQSHGASTGRTVSPDERKEGECLVKVPFGSAPYDLELRHAAGRKRIMTLGFRFRSATAGRWRFSWVHEGVMPIEGAKDWEWIESRKSKADATKVKTGIRFKDLAFQWTKQEAPHRDAKVETVDTKRKITVYMGPYDLAANEWLEIEPDTWGPTAVAQRWDDCFEVQAGSNAGNYYDDSDCWGGVSGNYMGWSASDSVNNDYNIGFRFQNITASGTANNGCKITVHNSDDTGGTSVNATLWGEDQDSPAAWSAGRAPSGITKTTASVTWNVPYTSGDNDSPEIKTIIQEIFDRGGWSSGNDMCFYWEQTNSSGENWASFTSYDNPPGSGDEAELTIVYTVASGDTYLTSATPSLGSLETAATLSVSHAFHLTSSAVTLPTLEVAATLAVVHTFGLTSAAVELPSLEPSGTLALERAATELSGSVSVPQLEPDGTIDVRHTFDLTSAAVTFSVVEVDGTITWYTLFDLSGAVELPSLDPDGGMKKGVEVDMPGAVTLPSLEAVGDITNATVRRDMTGAVTLPSVTLTVGAGSPVVSHTFHLTSAAVTLPSLLVVGQIGEPAPSGGVGAEIWTKRKRRSRAYWQLYARQPNQGVR